MNGNCHIVTKRSWNGYAYECYLCHDIFHSLPGLNAHLESPKHDTKMYICPGPTCHIRYSTLSRLIQHINSERCGVSKFKLVQELLERLDEVFK
ncbi:zinc finger protein, partial [Cyathus striatus]